MAEDEGEAGWLRPVDEDGAPAGPIERVDDLAAAITVAELDGSRRWVLPSAEMMYPGLLDAGAALGRCVDLALTEGLLLGYDGRWGESR
ncbi:MAG TPA: bifunctional 3'-5' exonuclease/DNA polymerase, partial [Streptomyces sp.]